MRRRPTAERRLAERKLRRCPSDCPHQGGVRPLAVVAAARQREGEAPERERVALRVVAALAASPCYHAACSFARADQ